MIYKLYSVYDKAVEAFMPPFMMRSHGEAMRAFCSSVKDHPDFKRNVRDYALYYLSDFNDLTGEYGVPEDMRLSVPQLIMSGFDAMQMMAKEVPSVDAGWTEKPVQEVNGRLAPSNTVDAPVVKA